ncbi:MAG: anthranilate synthase component I family protein [Bacteroidota bacterium]
MIKIKSKIHRQLSDFNTPLNTLLAVREKYPLSLLLESSDYQSKENSYSFIGFDPIASIKVEHNRLKSTLGDDIEIGAPTQLSSLLEEFRTRFKIDCVEKEVLRFSGLFGYSTFESVKYYDNFHFNEEKYEGVIPDVQFHLFKYLVVFDHYNSRLFVIENRLENEESKLDDIIALVNKPTKSIYGFEPGEITSNMSDEDYKGLVTVAKQHCQRGDVFQLVLSRKYTQQYYGDDINVYRALRAINPSPYLFYFDYGDFKIMGSSPEAHILVRGSRVEIHPIAGTMKRSGDNDADNKTAMALAEDPKENAEHNMLVDLARNDLSKHCTDVKVSDNKVIQYFSHVIHLVSKVVGNKPENVNAFQVLEDTFPAGTLSGAPKHMAIELINRYEPKERGFYGGAIGYVNFNGDMNMAITIRSVLSKNQELHYQAGAGIVVSSKEENELQEVENKLGAIQAAVKMAQTI